MIKQMGMRKILEGFIPQPILNQMFHVPCASIANFGNRGRPRHVRTIERIVENPGASTRKIGLQEGIANCTVWKILHEEEM